jgi:hypothetical protein
MRNLTSRRWLAFAAAATVLTTGLILLSAQATDNGLAPLPGPDDTQTTAVQPATNDDGSPDVDRLNTCAETQKKGKVSKATGGGKGK